MIQRIQTLLLAGVVILLIINLFTPIWTNTESDLLPGPTITLDAFKIQTNTFSGVDIPVIEGSVKNTYYIAGMIVVCIGLAVFIIFQYKNRPKQLMYCNLLTVLTLMIIGSYFIAIPAAKSMMLRPSDGSYEIGYFLPIVASLLTLGARYFIRKDEELVKSVDRLR